MIAKRMCDFFATILVSGILYTGCLSPDVVQAQNTTCATRPVGDSSNACASTAFVGTAVTSVGLTVGGSPITGGTNKAFFYNNGGVLGNLTQPGLDLRLSAATPSTVCAGGDDTVTFQAAVNSSSAHGNTINVPALGCRSTATGVSLLNAINVKISGQGTGWGLDSGGLSGFDYSAATGSLFSFGNGAGVTGGIDIGNLRLSYSNAAYNGSLIDISPGVGSTFSEFVTVHDCFLGSQTGATTAAALINISSTLSAVTSRCLFNTGAAYGIKGGTTTNVYHVEDSFFNEGFTSSHVHAQGQAWLLNTNSFEPRTLSLIAGSISVGGTTFGLTAISNGFQDATSGTYADLTGGTVYGFNFFGNFVNFSSGAAGITVDLGAADGATITGNYLGTGTNTCAVNGASAQNVVAFGNKLAGATSLFCTYPIAGNNFFDGGPAVGWILNSLLEISSRTMVANTSADGFVLKNPVAATAGNQQFSPRLRLTGQGWKTNATAGNQTVDFIMEVQPVQGAASPSANLVTSSQINGGGYTGLRTLFSSGGMNLGAPTGGDKGAGTLNVAGNLYINNVAVLTGNQSITLSGDVTGTGTTAITTVLTTAQPAVHTWALAQTFTVAPVFTDQSGSRTALGLGTAATQNTGTSGANVPLLNGANTWSAIQTFSSAPVFNALPTGTAVASANTASTLVARDGSNNFAAGTITASLTGHASLDLALTGGTMGGAIAMGGNNITGGGTITGTTLTSTIATGTAPLTVTSTTNVANLNASSLNGTTFAAPGAIGGGTAAAGTFTTLAASATITASGNIQSTAGTIQGAIISATGGRSDYSAVSETFALNVRFLLGQGAFRFGATNSATPDGVFSNNAGTELIRMTNAGGLSIGTTSDPGAGMIYTNAATFMTRTKTSWSNGAGAATATLTNAPAATNPTKWIPVDDNGTTRYIPAW